MRADPTLPGPGGLGLGSASGQRSRSSHVPAVQQQGTQEHGPSRPQGHTGPQASVQAPGTLSFPRIQL